MTELIIQPPTHDARVAEGVPDSNDGSTATTMRVLSSADNNIRVFVKFDLSEIPSHAIVDAVSLHMFVDSKSTGGSLNPVVPDIERADASWDESTITWNNRPGVTGSEMNLADTQYTDHPDSGWIQYPLRVGEVETMRVTNNGMRLKFRTEGLGDNPEIFYRSSEHATVDTRPKLAVSYTLPGAMLVDYIIDINDPHRRVYDPAGQIVSPEEIRPNAWWEIQGLELPSGVVYDSMVDDPTKFYGAGVEWRPDSVRVIGDRSDFADLIIRRAAAGV